MSSTNRTKKERDSSYDYYVTPQEDIRHFLQKFGEIDPTFNTIMRMGKVLDPCAGGEVGEDNQITTEMSYPVAIKDQYGRDITTIDIREDSPAQIHGDFLEGMDLAEKYNVIISNPPFNIIEEFINKCLTVVEDGGYVIMLCRLNYFGSKKRFEFFKKSKPNYCMVHHKRMSFLPSGQTDSIEYCHNVWIKGTKPQFTNLLVI